MSKGLKDCLPFFILFTIITFLVKDNAFFWDTLLQASKYAHYYYESNFENLFLPAELDAGHPPLFGMYLAMIWKVFGKSLAVAHFAMLPFLLGIVWQVYRLINYFTVERQFLVLLLVLTNTILLGHSTLVSPDIAFLFCFLLSLNGILYLKRWQIVLGTMGLGLLSIRGLFALVALLGIHLKIDKQLKPLAIFLPAILCTIGYYTFHYLETGWWLSTPHEGWSHHRGLVGPKGIFRNGIILGWRLVDFGNIALWLAFLALLVKGRSTLSDQRIRLLFSIALMILLCYAPALLLFQNPIGHRYLLPFYILFAIFIGTWLTQSGLYKTWIFAVVMLVQLSGNFWVYPKTTAKGWDCTMAHLPYYKLMNDMTVYLQSQNIDFTRVGTEFPNSGNRKYINPDKKEPAFPAKDMQKDQYILYSNIFNDFSDEALLDLEKNWKVEKALYSGQVYVILYKR